MLLLTWEVFSYLKKGSENMIYIYLIENKTNKKKYIGQTINYDKRMKEHIYGRNSRQNSIIDRAIKKHGKEKFCFSILQTVVTQEEADEMERYYISYYTALKPDGYNVLIGGRNQQGSWNQRKVYMYNLNGIYMQEFDSASEIERWSNSFYLARGITNCCLNKKRKYKDKIFRYECESVPSYEKPASSRGRVIHQFDLKGAYISSYNSITEASLVTKTSRTTILCCAKGRCKSGNGFIWSYNCENVDPIKPIKRLEIYQLDSDYKILNLFVSCSEAERSLSLRKGAYKVIYSALDSNSKRYGYYWVRKDNHVPSLCK